MVLELLDKNTVLHFITFFKNKGINDNGICGLLGNIYAESGVRTNNLQNSYEKKWNVTDESYTSNVDRGTWKDPINGQPFAFDKGGYGLCQWTSSGRKSGLQNLSLEMGKSIANEEVQFEWLWYELTHSYRKVYAELISDTNSIYSCAEIVVCKYEIPKSVLGTEEERLKTVNRRTEYANAFYEQFFGKDKETETVMAKKNVVVAINAGHWLGNPKGVPKEMRVLGGTLEWTLNSRVVDKVVELLSNYDEVTVVQNYDVTGQTKVGNELSDRIRMAEKAKADIYLSIHHNAADVKPNTWSGGGTTVYYYQGNTKNQASATRLYNEIKSRTGLKGNRSVPVCGTRSFQEINDTSMPAFLIECAFMNSTVDIEYIAKPEWATQVANGIIAFLVSEFGLTKNVSNDTPKVEVPKEEPKPTPTPTPTVSGTQKVKVSSMTRIYSRTNSVADTGVYTITEVENGMGKLKSGAGWIPLADTKKV